MGRFRGFGVNFALLLISTAVSLVILEVIIRVISPMPVFGPYFDLRPYKKLKLYPDLRGLSCPAWHTANRWGMRGDDPPANWDKCYTIIAVGGSTTQCFYLDDQKTWPHLLQEHLRDIEPNVWVGNAGLDGHSSLGHRLMMKKVVQRLRPDAVVLLVGANDLWSAASGNRYDNRFIERISNRSLPIRLYEHSRLLQILYLWKRIVFDDVTVVRRMGHGNYIPQELDAAVNEVPGDMEHKAFAEYQRNIRSIISIARECDTRLVFLTQPTLFEDNEYWAGISDRQYWIRKRKHQISAAATARLLSRINQALMRICNEEQVECFDLAARVPHSFEYFYDAFHFTEKGASLVASEIAAHFSQHGA
ncbi:MAG: SGNH/GDSL hydrolase family protein [Candidatus Eisenbacteria sp.]|nr:SGNH/GDSL hydrolase family protein [Candidatus Eisenbacteria bacterium]